ncbi:hypothetical protein H6G17_04040 [Chroococcidiopsis sp. FACHB-1243]|uniref:hypothetical protein n=1 Tax=Chroococcidiopsis sp. [FACHB-1243] TaxID=2692781 RepID=UPI0017815DF7|nr:hypothetical protein [Chroococcidiopsis sp. [FACHB-1243]]MBD2304690.1 hypothetical protein [Chroococcidiopsis sp. [FACHB-1243]]
MSQEPSNSQKSPSPERKPKANSFQAAVKTQTIKLLRGTIGVIEGAIAQLEAEPTTTTEASWWEPLQDGWSSVLGKIRSVLPANLSGKLSNSALTGIMAGIVVVLVLTTSNLFPGKPTEVAVAPTPRSELPVVTAIPSPTTPEPSAVTTTPASEPEIPIATTPPSTPSPTNEPSPAVEVEPKITIPSELTAPAAPQPVKVPKSMPTLVAQLTPEEILVATIQKQVEEISDRVADGLIQSIQPNFGGSNLVLTLGDDWYDLQSSEQDKLAAQMLERSRELDFSRLEAIDPKGNIIARSPVVGKDMIIFRRQDLSSNL